MDDLYDACFDHYTNTDREAEVDELIGLLDETVNLAKSISTTVRDETNLINYWIDYRNARDEKVYDKVESIQQELGTKTSLINNELSNLQSIQNLINDKKQVIEQKEEDKSFAESSDPLEVKVAELLVTEAEDKLIDLKEGGDEDEIKQAQENLHEKELSLKKLSE
jgi:hypothetical protein